MGTDLKLADPRPWPVPGLLADVDKALDRLPLDTNGAIVAFADQNQAGLAVVARLGKGWSFVGRLDKPWSGKLEGSASVVKFW